MTKARELFFIVALPLLVLVAGAAATSALFQTAAQPAAHAPAAH